jgi:hypothetical protein
MSYKTGDTITLRVLEVQAGPVVLAEVVGSQENVSVLLPKKQPRTYPIRQWRSMEKKIKAPMRDPLV